MKNTEKATQHPSLFDSIKYAVKDSYKKVESTAVNGYKTVEKGAVRGFDAICDKCVDILFSKDGETAEETKARLSKNQNETKK